MNACVEKSAVDAGAISARAKPAAAAEKMRELLAILKQRGCQEEFVADPELLANGQVMSVMYVPTLSQCLASRQFLRHGGHH